MRACVRACVWGGGGVVEEKIYSSQSNLKITSNYLNSLSKIVAFTCDTYKHFVVQALEFQVSFKVQILYSVKTTYT